MMRRLSCPLVTQKLSSSRVKTLLFHLLITHGDHLLNSTENIQYKSDFKMHKVKAELSSYSVTATRFQPDYSTLLSII